MFLQPITSWKFITLGVVLQLSLLSSSMVFAQEGPPPAMVRVGQVVQEELIAQWDVVGRLRELRRATVAAELSGRIVSMPVEEGDRVKGGKTVLVQIDDVWAKIKVARAEADLSAAEGRVAETEAALDQARRDATYLEQLEKQGSARVKEVEDAQTLVRSEVARLASAKAELLGAKSDLKLAKEELDRSAVKAPFDGIVISKQTEVGQWVDSGAAVVEIISVGQIDAYLDVPERFVNQLAKDTPIEVVIDPLGREMFGKVAALIPSGSSLARTFPVKVRLDNAKGELMAGMSVTAHVPTGRKAKMLTVPRDAIQRDATGAKVWANLNGSAMPINVRILFGVDERYAIEPKGGGPPLMPGMQVVIEGAERLFPTQPLNIVEQNPKAAMQQ